MTSTCTGRPRVSVVILRPSTASHSLPIGENCRDTIWARRQPQGPWRPSRVRDEEWQGLADEALERLLIERWLYRGMMLGVIFLSAIVATYLGIRGIGGLVDQVTLGVVLALALAAATVAWTMRYHDLKIHRELRRRRSPPASGGRSA